MLALLAMLGCFTTCLCTVSASYLATEAPRLNPKSKDFANIDLEAERAAEAEAPERKLV